MMYRVVLQNPVTGHEKVRTCNQNKIDEYVNDGLTVISSEPVKPPVVNLPAG